MLGEVVVALLVNGQRVGWRRPVVVLAAVLPSRRHVG